MPKKFSFPCGCKFDVIDDSDPDRILLDFTPDVESMQFDCTRTWGLFADGDTKGIFQLESPLGRSISQKLKPNNINELSALIAILRPGCMESIIDGKTITQHYIDRKHGLEEVTYYHPILKNSLSETYGLLVYQEQAMKITQDVANFDLQQADTLRRAIGKKLVDEMTKVKTMFLKKAKEVGVVSVDEAEEIFSWIEKSQRYSFNKSHSMSYAYNGYQSAFCKAHFTRAFFTSYLYFAKENKKANPRSEIRDLINNAKTANISVKLPDLRKLFTTSLIPGLKPCLHSMLRNKHIYIGLSDVKEVGIDAMDKMIRYIEKLEKSSGVSFEDFTWEFLLIHCVSKIKKTVFVALIEVGALDYLGHSRTTMLRDYEKFKEGITGKYELLWMQEHYKCNSSLVDALQDMIDAGTGEGKGIYSKKRLMVIQDIVTAMKHPSYSMVDNPAWIVGVEEARIGVALSHTKVETRDISAANTTCREFVDGKSGYIILACQINSVNVIKTKSGKNPGQEMAFVTASDESCPLENVVIFPDTYKEFGGMLIDGNTVMLGGERGRENGLIVKKVWQI